MSDERVQGLAAAYALIDALPAAVDREMGKDLAAIGKIVLQAQQAAVPEATGALRAGLSVQLLIDQLRVRVGLIGTANRRSGKSNLGSLFYGIIVNFGRKAQVVRVERIRAGTKANMRTLNGRKRAESIAATYSLPVTPLPPREFIQVGSAVDQQVTAQLADFWARTIAAAPGGSS